MNTPTDLHQPEDDASVPAAPTAAAPSAPSRVQEKLRRTMLRTVAQYHLIEAGDRILIAVSGGKDSYTLLDLLTAAKRRAPVDFELVAFHLDQGHPGYDGHALRKWLETRGTRFEIERQDTYSLAVEQAAASGKSYCAPCSRLRRGILYSAAARLDCNKIALGHHRDDALETLLLNLFYGGKLQSMPPSYRTNDDRFDVIRPLIECSEDAIREHASIAGYPILPCNLCGSQSDLKRVEMSRLLRRLERDNPQVREVMLAALKNVRPSHLLDMEVAAAWERACGDFAPRR